MKASPVATVGLTTLFAVVLFQLLSTDFISITALPTGDAAAPTGVTASTVAEGRTHPDDVLAHSGARAAAAVASAAVAAAPPTLTRATDASDAAHRALNASSSSSSSSAALPWQARSHPSPRDRIECVAHTYAHFTADTVQACDKRSSWQCVPWPAAGSTCCLPPFHRDDAFRLLSGVNILYLGDSTARRAASQLYAMLSGEKFTESHSNAGQFLLANKDLSSLVSITYLWTPTVAELDRWHTNDLLVPWMSKPPLPDGPIVTIFVTSSHDLMHYWDELPHPVPASSPAAQQWTAEWADRAASVVDAIMTRAASTPRVTGAGVSRGDEDLATLSLNVRREGAPLAAGLSTRYYPANVLQRLDAHGGGKWQRRGAPPATPADNMYIVRLPIALACSTKVRRHWWW